MRIQPRWWPLIALAASVAGATGFAQQRPVSPHVGYVFPAGGRQGTTVDVAVGGQYLAGPIAAVISGSGVHADVGEYTRPMTNQQAQALREKLEAARKKLQDEGAGIRGVFGIARLAREAGITDAELRALDDYRRMRADPKRQPNPQIEEQVKLSVHIDVDAAPGDRELRIVTLAGMSNPIRFQVGQHAECNESEPNDIKPAAGLPTALPMVINGQILPGDVDRFAFQARKGAHVVIAAAARELMPYLADAVPGWFQPVLTLFDSKGRRVAFAESYRYSQDPVLFCAIPADGAYTLDVHDAVYRGREDFVYRITVGEIPFITGIFPMGGRNTGPTTVAVSGWNLPMAKLTVDARGEAPGAVPVMLRRGTVVSNGVPFEVGDLPEQRAVRPKDGMPQAVKLPVVMNGRIDRPGRSDAFRFAGRAGSEIVAEVTARRLGSPLDSFVWVTDASGKPIGSNDDFDDPAAGMITHQADSYLRVRLPKMGAYTVHIRDAQSHGGADYGYRLRLSAPRPDFGLRVVPGSIGGPAGATVPVTVYALRRDGFSGAIALTLAGAPAGFVLSGGRIPAKQDRVRVTVRLPGSRTTRQVPLRMVGRATVDGKEVAREATACEDMMQAFAYHHLVPADEWLANINGRRSGATALTLPDAGPVKIASGGSTKVRVTAPAWLPAGQLRFALSDPPEGLEIQAVAVESAGVTITLRSAPGKLKPGAEGNLIVEAFRETPPPATATGKAATRPRQASLGLLPAIPFLVTAPAR